MSVDEHVPQNSGTTEFIDREVWQNEVALQRGVGEAALSNLRPPIDIDVHTIVEPYGAVHGLCAVLYESGADADDEDLSALLTRAIMLDETDTTGLAAIREEIMRYPTTASILSERSMESAHQELVDIYPKVIEDFTRGIRNGIALGYIPAHVEERLHGTLHKTSVRIVDNATLQTSGGMAAYYHNDWDEIAVQHNANSKGENNTMYDLLLHELTHKISGGTFKYSEDSTEVIRPHIGFASEIRLEVGTREDFSEAITHHVTLGIKTGDFETMDPDIRGDDSTYYTYRKIAATFVEQSRGLVDLKTLIHAFFEDTEPSGATFSARRKLIAETREAFGPGALNKLDALLAAASTTQRRNLVPILSRIHPPQLDATGSVLQRGYIDTANLSNVQNSYIPIHSGQLNDIPRI